jgi:hypothetical protein
VRISRQDNYEPEPREVEIGENRRSSNFPFLQTKWFDDWALLQIGPQSRLTWKGEPHSFSKQSESYGCIQPDERFMAIQSQQEIR